MTRSMSTANEDSWDELDLDEVTPSEEEKELMACGSSCGGCSCSCEICYCGTS